MEGSVKQFRKLLLFSGAFNVIMASPLIFPIICEKYFLFLWATNQYFSLGGKPITHPGAGISALLINTAGIALVLIGVIVLYSSSDPMRLKFIPFANAIARILFASLVAYYYFVFDIARLILIIAMIDVIIGSSFIYFCIKIRNLKKYEERASLLRNSIPSN